MFESIQENFAPQFKTSKIAQDEPVGKEIEAEEATEMSPFTCDTQKPKESINEQIETAL
jgi:hypothetical protein